MLRCALLFSRYWRKKYGSRAKPLLEFFSNLLMLCLRNTLHTFRLIPGAGEHPAGLAKMRRRFLRGPRGHLLYGGDGSHFAMYLQVLAQRARVPLRRQRDGCVGLHFPPILAPPTVLPPGSTLNFSMLFLKHDTKWLIAYVSFLNSSKTSQGRRRARGGLSRITWSVSAEGFSFRTASAEIASSRRRKRRRLLNPEKD
jgi:hypothetical protein